MPIYRTSDTMPTPIRLSQEEFAKRCLNAPRWCHDCILMHDGDFLLPERLPTKTPSGPWFIGGEVRMYTPELQSLASVVKRETKLDIDPARFKYITWNRYFFDGRDGGVPHDARCDVFTLALTDGEIESIQLDETEYVSAKLGRYNKRAIQEMSNPFTRSIFLDLWKQTHRWF